MLPAVHGQVDPANSPANACPRRGGMTHVVHPRGSRHRASNESENVGETAGTFASVGGRHAEDA
jgi:hypothetical protein